MRTLLAILLLAGAATAADPLVDQVLSQLPPGLHPTVLISQSDPAGLNAGGDGVTSSVVAVTAPLFASAREVRVPAGLSPAWKATLHAGPFPQAVAKGHVVLASFWVCAPLMTGGRSGTVQAYLERSAAPWSGLGSAGATCATSWRQVFVIGQADQDFAAGGMHLALHIGQQEQVLDFAGVVVLDLGSGVDRDHLPHNAITWPGMEADAPWRAVADQRIADLREGQLNVHVLDADGNPVAGAVVAVRQRRRACAIGSFTGGESPIGEHGAEAQTQYVHFYRDIFDRATVPLYWADWGWPSRRDDYLAVARWAAATGAVLRGHVLIYPGWQFLPHELQALKGDPKALQARCLAHIREMGEAYKGIPLREVDVTNELRDLPDLTAILGRDAVVEWFAAARAAFPGAKLALNENTILTMGGLTAANQDTLLGWYHFLKDHGQAPDVIGLQGHFTEMVTGPETVWKILDRFAAETTAELQITEFDVNTLNEEAQGAYTRDFLTAVFAHPRITGITMWGFWQGDHWLPNGGSWRADWTPKPAGAVIEDLLGKRWRTHADLTTGADGRATCRAFRGELDVTASADGRSAEAAVALDAAAEATIKLPRR